MRRVFSLQRNRAALRRLLRRLRRDRRGMAMIEFAAVLPVMLTAYFGIVEVAYGVMVDRKVMQLTRTLADLTTQYQTVDPTALTNIFNAAATVMLPYNTVAPEMSLVSVTVDSGGTPRVCWSEQRNGATAPARGSTYSALPADLKVPNSSVVIAKASYKFTPVIGEIITGPIKIGNQPIYMRPRLGKIGGTGSVEQVERSGLALCPGYS